MTPSDKSDIDLTPLAGLTGSGGVGIPDKSNIDPKVYGPLSEKLEPLWAAFVAGFEQSGEGYNAEWWHHGGYNGPYGANPVIQSHLRQAFERWVAENVLIGE